MKIGSMVGLSFFANRQRTVFVWVIVAVFGGIVLGLVYAGLRFYDLPMVAHRAEDVAKDYRKAGLPWEASDIAPQPPVKDEENAASLIRQAIRLEPKGSVAEDYFQKQMVARGQFAAFDKAIGPYERALDVFAKASEKPRVDFKRDWDYGAITLFPEFKSIKGAVKRFGFRAVARAGRGNLDGALADLRAGWHLSALAGQEPTLISVLVRVACETAILRAVDQCAPFFCDHPAALSRLQALLDEVRQPIDFPYAVRGEVYQVIASLRNFDLVKLMTAADQINEPTPPATQLIRTGLPQETKNRAYMAQTMQVWLEAKPTIDRLSDQPDALGKALDDFFVKKSKNLAMSNEINREAYPVFNQAGTACVSVQANLLAHRALASALSTRALTGALPTRIEDIPGSWIDPFSGKPLILSYSKGVLKIYSLGPNRLDDGGTPRNGTENYDLVASFKEPKR